MRLLILSAIAVSACTGSGEVPASVSGHIVGIDEAPLGPGLVLFERGLVHQGSYERGARINNKGRFTGELPSGGGTWGIHIFHSDYQYLPLEVAIADNQQVVLTSLMVSWGDWIDITGQPTWPDQPADSTLIRMPFDDNLGDNPVLESLTMTYLDSELFEITADVSDPDDDLSRMILAYDVVTGGGFAMNPPSPPDAAGNFPQGTYTLRVFLEERHEPGKSVWFFVVSDNLCNNSPVIERVMPVR